MKYKAVLFDLDGTLIDTVEDLHDTMNKTLSQFSMKPITLAQCRAMLGTGLRQLCMQAIPEERLDVIEEFLPAFRATYKDNCLVKTRPYPHMRELVAWLIENGVKVAVVTNKDEDLSTKIVNSTFGEGIFDVIRGSNMGSPCKPQPEPTLGVLDILGVSADETLFVGDGETDMEVARTCKIRSVWVSWGFRTLEKLGHHQPDIIVDDADQIKELVLG